MNKKNFLSMIKTFSEVYEKTLNSYVIEVYFKLFQEIPDSQVSAITKNCLRRCKYFPRPADVFEQLSETPEKYIAKHEPELTKEEIERNKTFAKNISEMLKEKFKMPKTGNNPQIDVENVEKGGEKSE